MTLDETMLLLAVFVIGAVVGVLVMAFIKFNHE
jgi:hypothetical protein